MNFRATAISIFATCVMLLFTDVTGAKPPTTQTSATTSPATQPVAKKAARDAGDFTSLALEDLMSLEVSSVSKTRQRLSESAAAVTVITPEDIDRSGMQDIPDILRLSPGLFVQRGNQFTGWSVSSRGFGQLFSDKLLVLQDGRTLYTPLFSGVYWNTVDYPIADLDRIEVIRGPGGTLWGANAMNGVINITSKSARDTQGLLFDASAGSDESEITARVGGKIDDNTFFRVYSKGRYEGDLTYSPNPIGEHNLSDDGRTGFRIDHYNSDTDTVTLQGDAFDQSAQDHLVTGHIVANYGHDYRSGENVLGRWTHVISDKSDLSLQMYYDHIDFRDAYSEFDGNTVDLDFQHRFELLHGHEILYGLGGRFRSDDVGKEELTSPVVEPTVRDTYLLSAFVQDTITLVPDRLHATLGTKLEQNSFTGFEWQPSGRLMWTPSETTSIWGSVSRAVRTPSLLEWDEATRIRVLLAGKPGELVKTSDHPQSEKLLDYEIGLRQQFTKTFSMDVTGFAGHYSDLIGLQSEGLINVPSAQPSLESLQTQVNGQSGDTYGAELSANWQVCSNWRLAGSYSLLFSDIHDDLRKMVPNGAAINGSFPQNQFQVHSYWDITRTVSLNCGIYYVQATNNGNVLGATGAPPRTYVRGDLNVNWHPRPGFELSAGIQNAFDAHHLEASYNAQSSAEVDRAIFVRARWAF